MEHTRHRPGRTPGTTPLASLLLASVFVLSLAPAADAAPPASRTYFTVLLGFEAPYSWQADCLTFTRTEICTGEGDCGTWTPAEAGPDGAFTFEMDLEGEGAPIHIEGQARFETRGRRDAIGGTGHAELEGQTVNFAFNGRSVQPSSCLRLVEDFEGVE